MELTGVGTPSAEIEVRGIQSVGVEVQGIQFAGIAVPGIQVGFGILPGEVEIQSVVVGIPLVVHSCSCPGAGSCWLDHQTPQARVCFVVKVVGVAPC